MSRTLTLNEQVAQPPLQSATEQVTVVVPSEKGEPLATVHVT